VSSPSRSDMGSSWNRLLHWRRLTDPTYSPGILEKILLVPDGFRRVPVTRTPDFCRNWNPVVSARRRAADYRGVQNHDGELTHAERRRLALIPEVEWQRLVDTIVKLRDEMESSGKYRTSEILQVQAAVAIVADPLTRPELRAQAIDRVWRMFERENQPDAADTNEAKEEEAQLKDSTTLDLMKKLGEKRAGGA